MTDTEKMNAFYDALPLRVAEKIVGAARCILEESCKDNPELFDTKEKKYALHARIRKEILRAYVEYLA